MSKRAAVGQGDAAAGNSKQRIVPTVRELATGNSDVNAACNTFGGLGDLDWSQKLRRLGLWKQAAGAVMFFAIFACVTFTVEDLILVHDLAHTVEALKHCTRKRADGLVAWQIQLETNPRLIAALTAAGTHTPSPPLSPSPSRPNGPGSYNIFFSTPQDGSNSW
jgi:hypothetical protein